MSTLPPEVITIGIIAAFIAVLLGITLAVMFRIMTAIETLNASAANLAAALNAIVVAYSTPHPTDSAVLAVATQLDAMTKQINDALNPPAPAPTA